MRNIAKLIIHCSYTPASMDIGAAEIRTWHTRDNGWSDIGYHYVIRRNGSLEYGREERIPGAHAKGHNHDSIGICLIGGKGTPPGPTNVNNFTPDQWETLADLIQGLRSRYPETEILGHNEVDKRGKTCPNFNVKQWALSIGLNPDAPE